MYVAKYLHLLGAVGCGVVPNPQKLICEAIYLEELEEDPDMEELVGEVNKGSLRQEDNSPKERTTSQVNFP